MAILKLLLTISIAVCISSSEGAKNFDAEDLIWYSYLDEIFDLLSSYEFQNETSLYNVNNLDDWGHGSSKGDINIAESNLNDFITLMAGYGLNYSQAITDKTKNDKIEDLNYVLSATIKSEMKTINDTSSGQKRIEGIIIKTRDIQSTNNVTDIFALNSIFVDKNIYISPDSVIGVMAQNWQVQHYSINILDIKASNGSLVSYGEKFLRDDSMMDTSLEKKGCSNVIVLFTGTDASDTAEIYWPLENVQKMTTGSKGRFPPLLGDRDKPVGPNCAQSSSNIITTSKNHKYDVNRAKSFEGYKFYLLENYVKNRFLARRVQPYLTKIYQEIDSKDAFAVDPISYLIKEFEKLETIVYNIDDEIDVLFLYNLLLQKVSLVAQNIFDKQDQANQKAIYYLYTAISARVTNIQNDAEIYLVINLADYLSLIADDINNLKSKGKTVGIDNAVNNYQTELDAKIADAKDSVFGVLQPRIEELVSDITNNVEDLFNEIGELIASEENTEEQLEEKKGELHKSFFKNILFGTLGGIVDIAGMFVPAGGLMANLIKYGGIGVDKASSKLNPEVNINVADPAVNINELSDNADDVLDGLRRGQSSCQPPDEDIFVRFAISDQMKEYGKKLSSLGIDVFKRYQEDEGKMKILEEQIEKVKNEIDNLYNMKQEICDTLGPVVDAITQDIEHLQQALEGKSEAQLAIKKWQISSALKRINYFLGQSFADFHSTDSIFEEFDELQDIVATMVNMYDIIDNYNDKKNVAQLMGDTEKDFGGIEVSDPQLQRQLDKLDMYTQCNMVLLEYGKLSEAVRQFSFPLADLYFSSSLPLSIELKMNTDLEDFTKLALNNVGSISHQLNQQISTIGEYDEIKISDAHFGQQFKTDPFYVWSKDKYDNEITRLLKGEQVTLKADIFQTTHKLNAIKFKVVNLELRSADESLDQTQIDSILDDYQVALIHTGNSYYNCNNRTFLIGSSKLVIEYSFSKIGDDPEIRNEVYTKLKNGNYTLSPYTSWVMKITPLNADNDIKALAALIGKVELHLVGVAQYYKESETLCLHDLDKYYTEVNTKRVEYMDSKSKRLQASPKFSIRANKYGDFVLV